MKKRNKLSLILILAVVFGIAPLTTDAYVLKSYKWSSDNVDNLTWKDNCDSAYQYEMGVAFVSSKNDWTSAVSAGTPDFTEVGSDELITVEDYYDSGSGALGTTVNQWFSGNMSMKHSTVWINSYPYSIGYYDSDEDHMQFVTGHELGHSLALDHTLVGNTALMHYNDTAYTTNGIYTRQSDDNNGVDAHYG